MLNILFVFSFFSKIFSNLVEIPLTPIPKSDISKKLNGTYLLLSTRLDKIYLFSDLDWDLPNGDFKTIYIFSIVAIFILLIASINYID